MNRVNALLGKLGTAGVLGIGVLLFCIPFYFSALQPAERELAAQHDAAQTLRSRGSYQQVSSGGQSDELRRFYALFPPMEKMSGELAHVYTLAREAKLELMQGEYNLESGNAGLVAYRITLPVRGAYPQIRSFVAAVLKEMPIASVDGLRFERKRAAETQLDAQIRLTINFRPMDDAETR